MQFEFRSVLNLKDKRYCQATSITWLIIFIYQICNALWILGNYGVNYTIADLSVETSLSAVRPELETDQKLSPKFAFKRTFLVFICGAAVSGFAFYPALHSEPEGHHGHGHEV